MIQKIPNLTEVRDQGAYRTLLSLLQAGVRDLRVLGVEPIIIASCPSKFNDASHDSDWRAVRVGGFLSERQEYFERPESHEKRMREGPENARAASRVLERLETEGWRNVYQRAFDRPDMWIEEVIALVLQDGGNWLVINGSNMGESAVYALNSPNDLVHVGRCNDGAQRFDQGLGEERPLAIRLSEEDAVDRAEADRRVAALESANEGEMPAWYRRRHGRASRIAGQRRDPWDAPTLRERLERLAQTGRASEEEYQALSDLISRSRVRGGGY